MKTEKKTKKKSKIDPARAKTKHICVRVTEEEYKQLTKVKLKSKKTISKLVREQLQFLIEYYDNFYNK